MIKQSTSTNNDINKNSNTDSIFGSNIPPEFIRLKGSLIKEIERQDVQADGVQITFKITDILGYGATFSKSLQPDDTITALTKFGHNSLQKSAIDSLTVGTDFIAEMEGNPIILNQYTIYKLQLNM